MVDGRSGFHAPDNQEIADAALVDGTIVAVGRDDAGEDRNAAVWTSSDGKRWIRASSASLGRIGEQRMDAVATVGAELVAVGSERTGGDTDPAVWSSADHGTTWQRVEGATSGLHAAGDQAMKVVGRPRPEWWRQGSIPPTASSTPRSGHRRGAPVGSG